MRLPHPPQPKTFTSPSSFCAVYSRTQRFLGLLSGGSRAARMASSNTFFSPRWERYGKKHEQKGLFQWHGTISVCKGLKCPNDNWLTTRPAAFWSFVFFDEWFSWSSACPQIKRLFAKCYILQCGEANNIWRNLPSHNISSSSGRHLSSTINRSTK